MKLANPFPLEVREWFRDCWACWECGKNGSDCGGLELHHIWGRISSSALNGAIMCKCCHAKVLHTQEEHQRLLRKTITFLWKRRYKLLPRDHDFLTCVQQDLRGFKL